MSLVTYEHKFCYSCQFGLERYLIPLKFRVDLLTPSNHAKLFSSFEEILDVTTALIEHINDSSFDVGAYCLGSIYNCIIDNLVEDYTYYFRRLPEAEKILSALLRDPDFIEFLRYPPIARRKPDITSFIHLPAEHLREVIESFEEILACYTDKLHCNFITLRDVKEKFMNVYRRATLEQNIMEPTIHCSSPGPISAASHNRNVSPCRRPLISTKDIEQRLVFTKNTKPFKLSEGNRQWIFGSELSKFEGKHLKPYWVMLFNDLLLFTAINRDRVIFVMEEPISLEAVVDTLFSIKKKATEFRLLVDTNMEFPSEYCAGKGSTGYLAKISESGINSRNSTISSGRLKKVRKQHRQTYIFRAPNVELKSTWENLLSRQIYLCQSAFHAETPNQIHGIFTPSVSRGLSTERLVSDFPDAHVKVSVFFQSHRHPSTDVLENSSESCDDLRSSSPHLASKLKDGVEETNELEEIYLRLEGEFLEPDFHPSLKTDSEGNYLKSTIISSRPNLALPKITIHNSDNTKIGVTGILEQEQVAEVAEVEGNHSSSRQSQHKSKNEKGEHDSCNFDIEVASDGDSDNNDDNLSLERARIPPEIPTQSKKNKNFFGKKFKGKLFSSKNQPPKKGVTREKKVENYVESIRIEEIETRRSVTPLFEREDLLKTEDFIEKRNEMLKQTQHNGFSTEVQSVVIICNTPSPKKNINHNSCSSPHISDPERERSSPSINSPPKRGDDNRPSLVLDGIEVNKNMERGSSKDVPITPEGYEDYLDGEIEEDYPELKSAAGLAKSDEKICAEEQAMDNDGLSPVLPQTNFTNEQIAEADNYISENLHHYHETQSDNHRKTTLPMQVLQIKNAQNSESNFESEQPNKACDPLSGSLSMSFMDETTPTSVDSGYDFYQRTTKAALRAESMCNKCISERNEICDLRAEVCKLTLDSSHGSLNTSVESTDLSLCNSAYNLTNNFRKSSSVSVDNETTYRNDSSNSSMSTSSNSVASEHSTIKPRSMLFIPSNTSSLPEISLEPPTPLAPKPRDYYGAEKKVVYDLKVPAYKSMFLTVPGLDDYDEDRYLPGTTYQTKIDHSSSSSSSSDNDFVHKPRIFASLLGIAERRGLKSYGSTNDLSKYGLSSPEDDNETKLYPADVEDNEINGNLSNYNLHPDKPPLQMKVSKIGGTKNGKFVASKLAMFEQVVEEERRKYLECQEARMRIYGRTFRHSGDYLTKFYQPQNPDVLRVQENELVTVDKARDNNVNYTDFYRPPSPFTLYRKDNSDYIQRDNNKENEDTRMSMTRQSSSDSSCSLKRQEEEAINLLEKSYQECYSAEAFEETSDTGDRPQGFSRGLIKSSMKRSPSFKDRTGNETPPRNNPLLPTQSLLSPLSPIIRREQAYHRQNSSETEDDVLQSPSRVRFSPVTDVFTRDNYSLSSEDEDHHFRTGVEPNKNDAIYEDNFLYTEVENSDEEEKRGLMNTNEDGKKSRDEKWTSKSCGQTDRNSKRRFALFRGQKKEEGSDSTFVKKALRGKRLILQKNKRKKMNSQDNQLSTSKESISDEDVLRTQL